MAAMLLSPTLLVLALVIVYPLLSAVHQSLFRAESGLDADGFVTEGEAFVGLANYADLFVGESGRRFLNAFGNTTFFTVTTVFLETVLGLCLALAMNRAFRGRAFLRASILVPWAVPTAVSGLLWRWIFQSDGIANNLLGSEILWTAEGTASKLAVIIAEVWKTAPFIGLLVLAGMQIIPEEVYEAAKIDGAGWWRQLGSITLPWSSPRSWWPCCSACSTPCGCSTSRSSSSGPARNPWKPSPCSPGTSPTSSATAPPPRSPSCSSCTSPSWRSCS